MSGISAIRLSNLSWRLPLSYLAIAVLTATLISLVLLVTLSRFYQGQERDYLTTNARVANSLLGAAPIGSYDAEELNRQLASLAFLAQARIRILDESLAVVADSGDPATASLDATFSLGLELGTLTRQVTRDVEVSNEGEAVELNIRRDEIIRETRIMIEPPTVGSDAPPETDDLLLNNNLLRDVSGDDDLSRSVLTGGFGFSPFFSSDKGNRSSQSVMIPIELGAGSSGFMKLSDGPAYGQSIIGDVRLGLAISGAIAVVISLLVGIFWARRILTPVRSLVVATTRMTQGDLSVRINSRRTDEVGTLATAFDQMVSQVESNTESLERFVSDAAHQIHSPLTGLRADIELAQTEMDQAARARHMSRGLRQVERLTRLSRGLLDLSRTEAGIRTSERAECDLQAAVSNVFQAYASRADQAGIEFDMATSDDPLVVGVPADELAKVVENLLDNALKYSNTGDEVWVSVSAADGMALLEVRDTGIGISTSDKKLLFDRFHRGENVGDRTGSGLGLTIARSIIDLAGGVIEIHSAGRGTTATVRLPVVGRKE